MLNKDKWRGFSDVSNIEGDESNELKIDNEDMWIFIFDSILNVFIGRCSYYFIM